MIKITILTLFPDFIESIRKYSIIGRAIENKVIDLEVVNIRDFSTNKNHKVDDEIYGGGPGMLITCQPVYDSIQSVRTDCSKVIYLSPQGNLLTQSKCKQLVNDKHLILLCGHYEGVDSRIINNFVDEEISIGDFVVSGGEIPALLLMDSVCRMVDGVLGNFESVQTDSHYNNILQHDVYTRPREFMGFEVPEVLLNGNHSKIEDWKKSSSIANTKKKRPDLYEKYIKENK